MVLTGSAGNTASVLGGSADSRLIVLGKLSAPFGVRGWIKVTSYTEPPEGILGYRDWSVVKNGSARKFKVLQGKPHGKFFVVQFDGIEDRDEAAKLTHAEIQVPRSQLPDSDDGYYWTDLIGLNVVTKDGVELGIVDSLMETGANDVLVLKGDRDRLVPWIEGDVIVRVDLAGMSITVDWDPEF